jgi:hypothetical protein
MKQILLEISDFEDLKTLKLFEELESLNRQDYLTKEQLLKILNWKSPRPLNHYKANSEIEIEEITKLAFSTENDILKIHILTALKGVSFPAASAILMFYDPTRYPVLDIRVWRQLYYAKMVDTNERGQNFSLNDCAKYFQVVRMLADELNITARQVEKRLFDYDKSNQIGNLYRVNVPKV